MYLFSRVAHYVRRCFPELSHKRTKIRNLIVSRGKELYTLARRIFIQTIPVRKLCEIKNQRADKFQRVSSVSATPSASISNRTSYRERKDRSSSRKERDARWIPVTERTGSPLCTDLLSLQVLKGIKDSRWSCTDRGTDQFCPALFVNVGTCFQT